MNRRFGLWAGLILLLALGLRSLSLDGDWRAHHGGNGALFGTIARNLLRYDVTETHGAMIRGGGRLPQEWRDYWVHQPPLASWVYAGSFALFGESAWALRLPSILMSTASVLLLILLVRRVAGDLPALVGGLLMATFPVTVYYGQNAHCEPLNILAILAATHAYLSWLETGRPRSLLALLCLQAVACHSGWPGYFLCVGLFLHGFLVGGMRALWMLVPCMMNFVHFGLYVAHARSLPFGAALLHEMTGPTLHDHTQVGLAQLRIAMRMSFWVGNLIGVGPALLMLAGIWMTRVRREGRRWSIWIVLITPFLLNTFLFADGIMDEEHHTEFIAPALAMLAALAVTCSGLWHRRTLLAFLAALQIGQAGWRIHDRFVRRDAWPVEYSLALALREGMPSDEGCVILSYSASGGYGYLLGWYADRDCVYARSVQEAKALLVNCPGRFRWVVSCDMPALLALRPELGDRWIEDGWGRKVTFLPGDAFLRQAGFPPDEEVRRELGLTADPRACQGFLFYDLHAAGAGR